MQRLGSKYELQRELGRGASSTVWLAHDPFADRDVAIKVATPGILQDPEQGRLYSHLFINEASLVGRLTHPHIVQIYDAVVDAGEAYIVMEYVPGGTLERFCDPDFLLPPERVVEIVFKCSRALAFAARLGITHRDIKPGNILLQTPAKRPEECLGDIKLSDFGAAITAGTDRTVVAGIGSPAYMSPEQVREDDVDFKSDIYSLGVVMYQLLTGHLPFAATTHYKMVYQVIHDAPPAPRALRPQLPAALERIVLTAMAKRPQDRFGDWEAFSQALADAFHERASDSVSFADSEKFSTLRSLPFFAGFSDVELWEVVRFARFARVTPGQVIVADGSPGDFFGFVADGSLAVSKHGTALAELSRGACFGEMAVIGAQPKPRGADVIARSHGKVITVDAQALRHSSAPCQLNFYRAFLEVVADRLAQANARLAGF